MGKDGSRSVHGSRRMHLCHVVLMAALLLATLVAYWPALQSEWIWDDDSYVTANEIVQSPDGVWRAWIPGQTPQYYPLVFVSFWLQVALHGLQPLWFHLVNVLLHMGSAVVLWRVLDRLGMRGALLAAALFALHPVQTESVAWVTERKNVLSMLCALLSVLAWVRGMEDESPKRERAGWFGLAFIAFAAAMLSKTTAVAVPVALLAIEWWRRRPLRGATLWMLAPYFLVGVGLGLNTAHLEATHVGASGHEFERAAIDRLLQAAQAWWFYPSSWVWPAGLVFIYPQFAKGPGGIFPWLELAAVGAALALTVVLAKRGWRGPLAIVAVYAAGIFPALGFFNVYPLRFSPVADHFGYVAGIAVCAALGWLTATAWSWLASRGALARVLHPIGVLLAGAVLAVLGALTWQHAQDFHDEVTLWTRTLEQNPDAWIAANNLASTELIAAREAIVQHDDAARVAHLERADQLAARAVQGTGGIDMPALFNLSEVRRLQGRYPEALDAVERAIAVQPRFSGAVWQRARLRELSGDKAGAGVDYAAAVKLDQRNGDHLRDYMRWLVEAGRTMEAREVAALLVAIEPESPDVSANLASLMLETGDVPAARAEYERALALAPEPLATRISVRMADACLRAPTDRRWIQRGRALADSLVKFSGEREPIPLLLLARAQALGEDPLSAVRSLAAADSLLAAAPEAVRTAAADMRARAVEALGGPARAAP